VKRRGKVLGERLPGARKAFEEGWKELSKERRRDEEICRGKAG